MGLFAADSPVQVGNAPPLGDVKAEQLCQLGRFLLGDGVAPGAELAELVALLVQGQVAVHHGGKAQGAQLPQGLAIGALHLLGHLGVGRLDALPGQLQGIGPHTAGPLVFPVKGAGGDGGVVRPDEHRLNAGRAQLNAANGLALPDGLLNLFQFHHKG